MLVAASAWIKVAKPDASTWIIGPKLLCRSRGRVVSSSFFPMNSPKILHFEGMRHGGQFEVNGVTEASLTFSISTFSPQSDRDSSPSSIVARKENRGGNFFPFLPP